MKNGDDGNHFLSSVDAVDENVGKIFTVACR